MTDRTGRAPGVVVDSSRSPYAMLHPVPADAVTIDDQFWAPRIRRNREVTLPSQGKQLWKTGRFENFLRVSGESDSPFQGRFFNDSDVYKWIEAASWSLLNNSDPDLSDQVDEATAIIGAAQQPDGYLNTYFALERADERWTDFDLHEMYCAGHLFQAAVAHHRATGSSALLDIATRLADHIGSVFGPIETGKRIGTDGHPEVEMGLVELFRVTGERSYLELAQFLVDVRGHGFLGDAYDRYGSEYHQDHRPFRVMDEIVGHAVRAVYLNAGVADIYAETGETALLDALHRLWWNMTERKMYVSGGIGSRYEGEAFGDEYELPNQLAYTETCAAIGSMMWSWRMLLIEGDARYADLFELQLYNAMLAGVSLDGETYFYQNPLADEGAHRRQPWFKTACCPPNVARTLASLSGYLYSVRDDAISIHHYIAGEARISLGDRVIGVRQTGNYPWGGEIAISVETAGEFELRLRIPGWSGPGVTVSVNGADIGVVSLAGSYLALRRTWNAGDVIDLSLPMPVRRIECHPAVTENVGRVALMRGPLLYCAEAIDNQANELLTVMLPDAAMIDTTYEPELLGGVTSISVLVERGDSVTRWKETLYQRVEGLNGDKPESTSLKLIPYYSWANREPGRMRVWIRRK